MPEEDKFYVRNSFLEDSGIKIICWNLGSSIPLQEVPPGTVLQEIETEEGKILNLWLKPTRADVGIPDKVRFEVGGEHTGPSGSTEHYTIQVTKSCGIPPVTDAENPIETPIWSIILVSKTTTTTVRERPVEIYQTVNVEIGGPPP